MGPRDNAVHGGSRTRVAQTEMATTRESSTPATVLIPWAAWERWRIGDPPAC